MNKKQAQIEAEAAWLRAVKMTRLVDLYKNDLEKDNAEVAALENSLDTTIKELDRAHRQRAACYEATVSAIRTKTRLLYEAAQAEVNARMLENPERTHEPNEAETDN